MKTSKFFCAAMLLISPIIFALPKVLVSFGESSSGFVQVKIKNETSIALACYVAIDGHKAKFKLQPRSTSRWFTSTDKRFNYQHFSTWCDYLDLHPHYQAYQAF